MESKEPFLGEDGRYHYTYKITSLILEKPYYYFGQHCTKNLRDGYFGTGVKWSRVSKGLGRENFSFQILSFYKNVLELSQAEVDLITPCLNDEWCCNLCKGGNVTTGFKHSKETIQKMKETRKGINRRFGELNNRWGTRHSEETKRKMSEKQKDKVISEEHKQRLREVNLGKSMSEETRCKIQKILKGQVRTSEQRQRISLAKRGDLNPAKRLEVRLKISNTLKERKLKNICLEIVL